MVGRWQAVGLTSRNRTDLGLQHFGRHAGIRQLTPASSKLTIPVHGICKGREMTTTPRSNRRSRPRRTHAERTAETTNKIKTAAVEAIAELGFKRASTTEIARRAGVSWGAAQHHFTDKMGILLAVLEDDANRFMDRIDRIPADGEALEKRVEGFVDAAWEHFRSESGRSATEILSNLARAAEGDPDLAAAGSGIVRLDRWLKTWSRLFGDVPLSAGEAMALQDYAVAVLCGLSSVHVLERRSARARKQQLGYLKDTLLRELTAAKKKSRI